jgi:hypothetical protein
MAPGERRLGRAGQIGADAVQAALAAVVGGVFGLPDDEHSVRATYFSADELQADGDPAADDGSDASADAGADDEAENDGSGASVAESIGGFDGAVAKLLGRLPRGEHMLIVGAGTGPDVEWGLLLVQRDRHGELTAMLMPAADLPPPLRPSRDALKAVRENFDLAPVPEAGPGVLNGRIGSVSDFDAAGLGATLERLLALAYRLPRDDFKFQATFQASD